MDDATQPWARQTKEPALWFDRFQRYLLLGVTRSVYRAYMVERMETARTVTQIKKLNAQASHRTGLPQSWRAQSKRWNWSERAQQFDEAERTKRYAAYQARADEILTSGLALQFARIEELKQLAELLRDEVRDENKRWLPDAKQIGAGEFAERVDIVRFNAPLVQQLRETIADIAIEKGERTHGVKLSGKVAVAQVSLDDVLAAADAVKQDEQSILKQIGKLSEQNE